MFQKDAGYLKGYIRFRFEPNFINEIKVLTEPELIEWLKSCSKISNSSFEFLKVNTKVFKNWKALSESDKLLFRNLPDEYIESFHQFDDFAFFKKFCPVELPSNVNIVEKVMANNYKQVFF